MIHTFTPEAGQLHKDKLFLDAIAQGCLFTYRGILTSAAAATPVILVPDANTLVPVFHPREAREQLKVFIADFRLKVNGATAWGTTSEVYIRTTAMAPTTHVTAAVAGLTANAFLQPGSANLTYGAEYQLGAAADPGYGLQVVADADGTGSDLHVMVLVKFER